MHWKIIQVCVVTFFPGVVGYNCRSDVCLPTCSSQQHLLRLGQAPSWFLLQATLKLDSTLARLQSNINVCSYVSGKG